MNKSWTIRNRTKWFWKTAWVRRFSAFQDQGFWRQVWHNLRAPSTGCGCLFCTVSKRRKFPPGHPLHPMQMMAEYERKLNDHVVAMRVRDDRRHDRIWGGS